MDSSCEITGGVGTLAVSFDIFYPHLTTFNLRDRNHKTVRVSFIVMLRMQDRMSALANGKGSERQPLVLLTDESCKHRSNPPELGGVTSRPDHSISIGICACGEATTLRECDWTRQLIAGEQVEQLQDMLLLRSAWQTAGDKVVRALPATLAE